MNLQWRELTFSYLNIEAELIIIICLIGEILIISYKNLRGANYHIQSRAPIHNCMMTIVTTMMMKMTVMMMMIMLMKTTMMTMINYQVPIFDRSGKNPVNTYITH